jgi:Family of unknown function (DUF6176)
METSCAVIELNPDSVEKVKEWAAFMNTNREEALLSLKNEGVTIESAFIAKIEGKDYFIGYMRAVDMLHASTVVKTSTLVVDAFHKAFKKTCWKSLVHATPVLDLSRIENEERNA